MTDPISDMLTRIRNANRVLREAVDVPGSRIKRGILEVLRKEGFIKGYEEIDEKGNKKTLRVYLKYGPKGEKVISTIKRKSKPSRRIYKKVEELKRVLGGFGIAILSTSKGIISDKDAKRLNVGGELLCTVW